ncbi:hypothetical protein [Natrinema sp. 1APR25-10V2]|uniref:hypothetical protein n=1 Tax=Natrinema sp. 1APR25-10V2 TaxID=2951081 RepID=UPI002874FFBE|nr:hypothetical protein [Natrinema sp. 1APR25-10V2]MDS0475869.1 hypothetical protein [Natrinema sp. 1APR25-10V2]
MDETDADRRTIAACEQCGSLYAALEFADETLRPIGRRDGCQCGCTEFVQVSGSLSESSDGDDD